MRRDGDVFFSPASAEIIAPETYDDMESDDIVAALGEHGFAIDFPYLEIEKKNEPEHVEASAAGADDDLTDIGLGAVGGPGTNAAGEGEPEPTA